MITYTTSTGAQALPPHRYTLALKHCTGKGNKRHCTTRRTRSRSRSRSLRRIACR